MYLKACMLCNVHSLALLSVQRKLRCTVAAGCTCTLELLLQQDLQDRC